MLSDSDSQEWKGRLEALKVKLELVEKEKFILDAERIRERRQFKNQIENLQQSLKISQETAQKVTLLLEDKRKESKAGDLEKSVQTLEQRIANQEKTSKAEQEKALELRKKNRALKQALEAEKAKSLWKKIFSKS